MWTKETLEKTAIDYAENECTYFDGSLYKSDVIKAFLEGANFILNKQQSE